MGKRYSHLGGASQPPFASAASMIANSNSAAKQRFAISIAFVFIRGF
jgi:hypothetical protein